jgi:hypothetical protein
VNSASHQFIYDSIKLAVESGLKLVITPRFLDETLFHFLWAADLVRNYGEQSMDVLAAAMGRGHYRRNECLDGFVRYSDEVERIPFPEYLFQCVGAERPNFADLRQKIIEFGLDLLPLGNFTNMESQFYIVRDETELYITERAANVPELQKGDVRIRAEAEVYSVLFCWDQVRPDEVTSGNWLCSFLSRGTFLNKISWLGPHPLRRSVTVRPDLLYDFLTRLEPTTKKRVPLKDILLAAYFRAANYFIDSEKYARFFAPLLNSAEEVYQNNLEQFRRLVSPALSQEYLSEFEPLERPYVVTGLKATADDMLKAEVSRLNDENERLRDAQKKLKRQLLAARKQVKKTKKGRKRRR